ncbi:hypothetical protein [Plantactinospora sp. WMMB782]|uniref:hypothetical protein n=1 Tax=Plantactinospora sp. WMMB782 TaxID=3404121 RepID=UPI003B94633A
MPNPSADTFSLASRRVVRFSVVYAVVVATVNALGAAGFATIRGGAAQPTELNGSALIVAAFGGLVALVCLLGLLISTVVWIVSAHRLTPAGPGLAGYGGLVLCLLLVASAFVLPLRMPTVGGAVAVDAGLRIGGVLVLVGGVLLARAQIRRRSGQPTLAGRPALVSTDDWDASKWDPEVLRDIERRRGSDPTRGLAADAEPPRRVGPDAQRP